MSEDFTSPGRHAADAVASSHWNDLDVCPPAIDETCALLQLAARMHTAHGDPQIWYRVLTTFRDQSSCHGALSQIPEPATLTPNALAALAGQLSHCATYGDDCRHQLDVKRQRCAAFAVHMHTAAAAVHQTRKATLFDDLPATWLVDRNAQVYEANATARALAESGERVTLVGKQLALVGPGGARALLKAVAKVIKPTRLPWKDSHGRDVSFLLRAQPDANQVTVTALLDAPSPSERAPLLAEQLRLTPRQSELAAHLLADHTVAGAARAMGISRNTANEHLAALEQRTGAANRKALLVMLRRIAQR